MTVKSALPSSARVCAFWWFALLLAGVATAGPPPPAPPAAPPQILIDPNAPDPAPAPTAQAAGPVDPVKVERGKRMYKDFCQKCHGVDMVSPGGGFFDLRTFPRDDKARFVQSVTNGKRAMPAWGGVLKPDDIDTIWVYVSSASRRAD
jgi:mono/diheme cytochrome c family protein